MIYVSFFLSGMTLTTFGAAGVFFFKFWKTSRDRFFLLFSWACALIAFERLVSLFIHATWEPLRSPETEAGSWIYLIRLAAFVVIFLAILGKNRAK